MKNINDLKDYIIIGLIAFWIISISIMGCSNKAPSGAASKSIAIELMEREQIQLMTDIVGYLEAVTYKDYTGKKYYKISHEEIASAITYEAGRLKQIAAEMREIAARKKTKAYDYE